MTTGRHQFPLTDLPENAGEIRTARLLAFGEDRRKGDRPTWLNSILNFTPIRLQSGSTLGISTSRHSETAQNKLFQQEIRRKQPSFDETEFDLFPRTIDFRGSA